MSRLRQALNGISRFTLFSRGCSSAPPSFSPAKEKKPVQPPVPDISQEEYEKILKGYVSGYGTGHGPS